MRKCSDVALRQITKTNQKSTKPTVKHWRAKMFRQYVYECVVDLPAGDEKLRDSETEETASEPSPASQLSACNASSAENPTHHVSSNFSVAFLSEAPSSTSSTIPRQTSSETAALWDKTRSFWDIKNPLSHERGSERSERASERVSAAEGASEASSPEQANE